LKIGTHGITFVSKPTSSAIGEGTMKGHTTSLTVVLCALVLAAPAGPGPRPQMQRRVVAAPTELELVRKAMTEAQPLTPDEVRALDAVQIPPACDYSKYVTFIRQQASGGCGTMASLSVLDILKERERPYSPDFSYRFAEYVYNLPGSGMDQMKVLRESGCCSEASLPSKYDPPGAAAPSAADYEEARMYRIASSSKPKKPSSAAELKKLLWVHGPLFACGDTPGSATNGHCFAVIGYDDASQSFTIVNSFGDTWGNGGMMAMPYANVANPPPQQTSPRISYVTYVTNAPTRYSAHPYTARVRIHHDTLRRKLTVRLGVEGQTPSVVWDTPNGSGPILDSSRDLKLDFPMPRYAARFWPPSEKNQWYLEVTDSFPSPTTQPTGVVHEISLVKRTVLGNGSCVPTVIRPSSKDFPVPLGGTVRVFIPARRHFTLSLAGDDAVARGAMAKLGGRLDLSLEFSTNKQATVPQADRPIELRRATRDQVEGTIVWTTVSSATTDAAGLYTATFVPEETSDYQAFAVKADGTVDAASNLVTVRVGTGPVPAVKQVPKRVRPLAASPPP
jgi:hypothetical protein